MKDATTVNTVLGMAELSDWCYEQTMTHAIYQGKDYHPCSTIWVERSEKIPEREWDPDRKCCGYWSCTNIPGDDGDPDDEDARFEPTVVPDILKPELVTYVFEGEAPLLFKGKPKIHFEHDVLLVNLMGENIDHRGSNHSNLMLWCTGEWTIPKGIHDVHTVLEGFWRIKYNKYDNYYEAFPHFSHDGYDEPALGSRDVEDIKKNIKFHGDLCKITPIIDHGS